MGAKCKCNIDCKTYKVVDIGGSIIGTVYIGDKRNLLFTAYGDIIQLPSNVFNLCNCDYINRHTLYIKLKIEQSRCGEVEINYNVIDRLIFGTALYYRSN